MRANGSEGRVLEGREIVGRKCGVVDHKWSKIVDHKTSDIEYLKWSKVVDRKWSKVVDQKSGS